MSSEKRLADEAFSPTQHIRDKQQKVSEGTSLSASLTSPPHHTSVLPLSSMMLTSPTKKPEMNIEQVHNLFLNLERRMCKQDLEVRELKRKLEQRNQTILDLEAKVSEIQLGRMGNPEEFSVALDGLREDTGNRLDSLSNECKALNDGLARLAVRGEGSDSPGGSDTINSETLSRELPQVSEGLARAEGVIENLRVEIKTLKRSSHLEGDQRDQYSRREIVRITGVPQTRDENTSVTMCRIAERLGVYITPNDISVSHRSGRSNGNNPRPILCKFVRRDVKNLILANRKLAKNITTDDEGKTVRIFIDEDLTAMRARVCKKLRGDKTPHHTRDGKVFIATGESDFTEFKVYDSPADWENLHWSVGVKQDVGIFPRD
jgi:hypothetical protein